MECDFIRVEIWGEDGDNPIPNKFSENFLPNYNKNPFKYEEEEALEWKSFCFTKEEIKRAAENVDNYDDDGQDYMDNYGYYYDSD
jgi:hypothetical protein